MSEFNLKLTLNVTSSANLNEGKSTRKKSIKKTASLEDLRLLAKKGFSLALTDAEHSTMWKNFHDAGVHRRICLTLLTKSSKELTENLTKNTEVIDSMLDVFEAWEERFRQQNEVLSTARARFFVVASQFCEDIKVWQKSAFLI